MNALDIYIVLAVISVPATIIALRADEKNTLFLSWPFHYWLLLSQVLILALVEILIFKNSINTVFFVLFGMFAVNAYFRWPALAKFFSIPFLLVLAAIWTHYLVPTFLLLVIIFFGRKHFIDSLRYSYGDLGHALDMGQLLLSWWFIGLIIADNFSEMFSSSGDSIISFAIASGLTAQSLLLGKIMQRLAHCNLLEREIVIPYRSLQQLTQRLTDKSPATGESPHDQFNLTIATYLDMAWSIREAMNELDDQVSNYQSLSTNETEDLLNIDLEQEIASFLEKINQLVNNPVATELQKETLLGAQSKITVAQYGRIKRLHNMRIRCVDGFITDLAANLPEHGIKPKEAKMIEVIYEMLKDLRQLVWAIEDDSELVSICTDIRERLGSLQKLKDFIATTRQLSESLGNSALNNTIEKSC
ncbi:MAG: hypothetical protein PHC51_08180 [bacterium]|nr:hypothetical protein [bacterium]